jgi:hypothetical protein
MKKRSKDRHRAAGAAQAYAGAEVLLIQQGRAGDWEGGSMRGDMRGVETSYN